MRTAWKQVQRGQDVRTDLYMSEDVASDQPQPPAPVQFRCQPERKQTTSNYFAHPRDSEPQAGAECGGSCYSVL